MRLNILLPTVARGPVGGFKVQYEYANRLVALGHEVTIYHAAIGRSLIRRPRQLARTVAWMVARNPFRQYRVPWFPLDERVQSRVVPALLPPLLKPADATILTAYQTAEIVRKATDRTGPLFQIVYDIEFWRDGDSNTRDRIQRALLRNDVAHIATSTAVKEMLSEIGVCPVGTVTCGVDLPSSTLVPPTQQRRPIIAFPLRREPHKGAADMLEAIQLVGVDHPQIEFECFGDPAGFEFPEGLKVNGYLDEQGLLDLYRRSMIFVLPSHAEGWGLPAAEAMANGAAVIVTDNGGSSDFAVEGENALVVPIKDPGAIAEAIGRLLRDESLRSRIVSAGMKRAALMSWDRSTAQLVSLLSVR